MRILNEYELDLIAGGTASSDFYPDGSGNFENGGGFDTPGSGGGYGGGSSNNIWVQFPGTSGWDPVNGFYVTAGAGMWIRFGDSGSNFPGSGYGSGAEPQEAVAADHVTQDCGSASGAAVIITNRITGADGQRETWYYGSNWKSIEFAAAVVRNSDGSYGALNDSIYTQRLDNSSYVPGIAHVQNVAGIVHNHPDNYSGDNGDLKSRYPSTQPGGDWDALQALKDASGDPNYDPSLWIIDPFGTVREFKLSDRAYYMNLTDGQMLSGVGLEGKERTESCH